MTVPTGAVLRPAGDADAAALESLVSEGSYSAFEALVTSESVIADGGLSAVAELRGEVVGHVVVAPTADADGVCTLAVAVHPDWRGRGVGTLLTEAAIDWALDHGKSMLILEVESENTVAMSLYKAAGFEISSLSAHGRVTMQRAL